MTKIICTLSSSLFVLAAIAPLAFAQPSLVVRQPDFNGDGHADLAVGAPGVNDSSGAVYVIYGGQPTLHRPGGLVQKWTQEKLGGTSEAGDKFGYSLTYGDFNGDGYTDLAIGAPYEDLPYILFNNDHDAGEVYVVYGSSSGLTSSGSRKFSQDTDGVADETQDADKFGVGLAAGDFNGDGISDLAIGAPGENEEIPYDLPYPAYGRIHVLYGTRSGLTGSGSHTAQEPYRFGTTFATGDFNGDRITDLAVGTPDYNGVGRVTIIPGSTIGAYMPWRWHIPAKGGPGFARALTSGDFDGDGRWELAVGTPNDKSTGWKDAGAVYVYRFGTSFQSVLGVNTWTQTSTGVGESTPGDHFGAALAAGNFNGDRFDDIAIGVPYELGGAVHVIYGSATGLSATRSQQWTQDSNGISGAPEAGDEFGFSLAVGNFGGSTHMDLAIGVPGETLGPGTTRAGVVHVLYGGAAGYYIDGGYSAGLRASGSQLISKDDLSLTSSSSEIFGWSLPGR